MNHLKYFNESILDKDIVRDLKDICLEIIEDGFNIDFINDSDIDDDIENDELRSLDTYSHAEDEQVNEDSFSMHIGSKKDSFKYDEVSEVVERIKDFMTMKGYQSKVTAMGEMEDGSLNYNIKSDNLFDIGIYFWKD